MNEINKSEIIENNHESKLLEKSDNTMSLKELGNYWKKVLENYSKNEVKETGIPERFYSKREERELQLPKNGKWEGNVGDSRLIVDNKEVNQELKKFNLKGIEYHDAVPDFSKCSLVATKIDKITPDLDVNFKNFCQRLVEEGKFKTEREVKEFKQKNNLIFHECSDRKTCQLVPETIHEKFTHVGGRFEARKYEELLGKKGVKFDE